MKSWCKVFIFVATIFVAAPAFSLEWHKAYERGRDRIKGGNCAEGQSLILQALQTNPRDDLRAATYGTQVMEYFPHYYLAVCAFRAGNGSEAARHLKEAESARITSSKLAGEFQALKPQIEALQKQQQAAAKPPVQTPTKPPEEQKPVVVQKPPPEKKVPPPVIEAKPDHSLLIRTILKEARNDLNDGRYEDAKDQVNRVFQLDPANADASRMMNDINTKMAAEIKANEKQQRFKEAQNALSAGNLDSAERQARALRDQYPSDQRVQDLLSQIQNAKNSQADTAKSDETQKNVERDVLMAYYRGEYDQAIRLANLGLPKVTQSWKLHFFLGCSYAALAMLDENGTQDRLKLARESFRRARSVSRSFSVPPYISPKILEIYRSS